MTRRLVIDTDIGTDVDDLWTLAMIPSFDDIALEAVTVVSGDVDLRARMAAVVCAAIGLDVPIHAGCAEALSAKEPLWAGHEGEGVDGVENATYASGHGVDALVEIAAASPGSLDIVAIGPLTNIATAIVRDPEFATNVRHLTVMGGEFARGWPEHNLASDVAATQIVLESTMSMTVVPLDQTLRVMVTESDVDAIAAAHPIGELMADQARRFWRWLERVVPGATGDRSPAHDPMALLALMLPDLFTFTPTAVRLADADRASGVVQGRPDPSSDIRVVTDLDHDAVHSAILHALLPVQ